MKPWYWSRSFEFCKLSHFLTHKVGKSFYTGVWVLSAHLLERAISGIYESSSSSRNEKCCVWVEFETCLNLYFGSDFNTVLYKAILKSCKYFWILWKLFLFLFWTIPINECHYTNVSFQSSWNSLYIENLCQAQSIDYKLESHSKKNKSVCRHFD